MFQSVQRSTHLGEVQDVFCIKPTSLILAYVENIINSSNRNNKCWRGGGGKGTPVRSWWERKLVQPQWETLWIVHKKLNIEVPHNSIAGHLPKENKNIYVYPYVYCNVIYNGQFMEATQMSIDR